MEDKKPGWGAVRINGRLLFPNKETGMWGRAWWSPIKILPRRLKYDEVFAGVYWGMIGLLAKHR